VKEAIETMQGGGPADFREHCLVVAAQMLRLAGQGERWTDESAARDQLIQHLDGGQALDKFRLLVESQGGDVAMVDLPERLPQADIVATVEATQGGFIGQVSAIKIAEAAFGLGAGREKKGDALDLAVGLEVLVKVGD
jgi:pyrimidine-nucleoside phosphorylase